MKKRWWSLETCLETWFRESRSRLFECSIGSVWCRFRSSTFSQLYLRRR